MTEHLDPDHFSGVKLLSLDVDGVLTDGGLYYTAGGEVQRKYNVRDGVGIVRALEAGIAVAVISAGMAGTIPARAETLGIEHVFTGVKDKLATLKELCAELGIDISETAHVGDDLNDLALMAEVGIAVAVADACEEVRGVAEIVTSRDGGKGAVREVCDALVKARTAV